MLQTNIYILHELVTQGFRFFKKLQSINMYSTKRLHRKIIMLAFRNINHLSDVLEKSMEEKKSLKQTFSLFLIEINGTKGLQSLDNFI